MINPPLDPYRDMSTDIPDDPRLLPIAREYLQRLEAGESPAVDDYLMRYPDLAEALAACLAGLDMVHRSVQHDRSRPSRRSHPPARLAAASPRCRPGR